MIIIMGDFNAKVGNVSLDNDVMGWHGLGQANERGERLIEFCKEHQLVTGNTLFQYHDRRKYTWTSPDGHTRKPNWLLYHNKEMEI